MNLDNPKVTVRMSAYNHEQYVEQAILSIINQTFQDFELLVIDDGSSDSTPEIIERLSREYGFYYERQENMGLVRTLNKLVGMAKGEYLTGCASDDFWPLTRLGEQVAAMDANPAVGLVHGLPIVVDSKGHEVCRDFIRPVEMLDGSDEYKSIASRKRRYTTTTVMARRDVYDTVGGYDEGIKTEDLDWTLRALMQFRIKAVPSYWTHYRKHGENWSMTPKGLKGILESNFAVCAKLPCATRFRFVYSRIPIWFSWERKIRTKRAYFYPLLLPLYFFHREFLYNLYALIRGR